MSIQSSICQLSVHLPGACARGSSIVGNRPKADKSRPKGRHCRRFCQELRGLLQNDSFAPIERNPYTAAGNGDIPFAVQVVDNGKPCHILGQGEIALCRRR